jgi:hypothetical protein
MHLSGISEEDALMEVRNALMEVRKNIRDTKWKRVHIWMEMYEGELYICFIYKNRAYGFPKRVMDDIVEQIPEDKANPFQNIFDDENPSPYTFQIGDVVRHGKSIYTVYNMWKQAGRNMYNVRSVQKGSGRYEMPESELTIASPKRKRAPAAQDGAAPNPKRLQRRDVGDTSSEDDDWFPAQPPPSKSLRRHMVTLRL